MMSARGAKCCRENRAQQRGRGGESEAVVYGELRAGLSGKATLKQKPETVEEEDSQAMETTRAKSLR